MTQSILGSVLLDGKPAEILYPGWSAISRHPCAGGLDVVLMREESGREACWWVDHDSGTFEASHVLALSADVQDRFLIALDPVFQPLADGVLGAAPLFASATLPTDLPEIAVLEAAGSWTTRHSPNVVLIPSGHADSGEGLTCPDGRKIAPGRIRALMDVSRGGETLVLASPFSEIPLRAQLTMREHGMTAYRFHDEVEQVVFYMVWNDARPDQRPSFYYPSGTLLISDDPRGAFIPALLLAWYATHPEHPETLQQARPFLPHDFGVGRASALRQSQFGGVQPELGGETAGSDQPPSRASFAAPSFLPDIPDTPLQGGQDDGILGRIRRLFGNHTHRK